MGLRMIVTVKQVPDTHNVSGDAMKPDGTVNRAILPAIFNPEDLNALEEALALKDRYGGTVTVITMGPPKAVEILKECLYRGADDAVLLSDKYFAGADTLATSYALKCAVEKMGQFDLVFSGRQAIDGDTAQVGPQLAEKLGINQLTCVSHVLEVEEGKIKVQRALDDGFEVLKAPLPVLLTLTGEANEPRSFSAKRAMIFKRIEKQMDDARAYVLPEEGQIIPYIKEWNIESVGADQALCGLSGSPTKVKAIHSVVLAASDAKDIPVSPEGIKNLIKELTDEYIIG
jgi:electron transfer flavoprotein beta subunit